MADDHTTEPFATAFRGYDKPQVDDYLGQLRREVEQRAAEEASAKEALRRTNLQLEAANVRADEAEDRLERLAAEIQEIPLPTDESAAGSTPRVEFEEILRVAEEQANTVITNSVAQGEKFVAEAKAEVAKLRAEAEAEAEAIRQRAEHELAQARIRIDTERAAAQAQIEQDLAVAAGSVEQTERESAAALAEAERDAAAIRQAAETDAAEARAAAERIVSDARATQLEHETALTRREDQAQQEFLALHNQAVAHAERIVKDANESVQRALDHAKRIEESAKVYEQSARAQAAHTLASADTQAAERLESARSRAQAIVDTIVLHSKEVTRDAEDRARGLRVQQQKLSSFLTEVGSLVTTIAADGPSAADEAGTGAVDDRDAAVDDA